MKFILVLLLTSCGVESSFAERLVIKNQITITATTTSTLALAKNENRKYLIVQNNGTTSIYVKFISAHTGVEGVLLQAGGVWEDLFPPIDDVYIKTASSTDSVNIIEGT